MKKGRTKNSDLNGRRRSLSSDKEIIIKHRRKRSTDVCNNTLPVSKRSSGRLEILDELEDIVDVVSPRTRRKTLTRLTKKVVSIDLTEDSTDNEDSAEESPSMDKLSPSIDKPSSSTDKPSPSTDKPSPSTDKPSPSADKPSPSADKPSPSVDEPSPSVDEPSPSVEKLSPSVDKPSPSIDNPSPSIDKPSPSIDKPSPSIDKPSPSIDLPSPPPSPVLAKSVRKKTPASLSDRCKYCGVSKKKVTKSSAPLPGANEEEDVLNFHEIRSSWKIENDLPCLKLVDFRVYDKARHLCPFDGKLIRARDGLYFSGFVKPFNSEKTDLSDAFPCEKMGPITDWWFEGFSLDEESLLGFSTEMGYYYLTKPMSEYAPFMASVKEKIFMAKIVIDILDDVSEDEELSYESLLDILKTKVPPEGIPTLTEEILLKNGVFVCGQIQSFDANAEEKDKLLASMRCVEVLSRKVNYDFNAKSDDDVGDTDDDSDAYENAQIKEDIIDFIDLDEIDSDDDAGGRRVRRRCKYFDDVDFDFDEEEEKHVRRRSKAPVRFKDPLRRGMGPTSKIKLTKATTTPLVETIFLSFFSGQIMKNYSRDYSNDTVPSFTTNSIYNATRSYDDYNLMTPNLCLTKLEDMGIDYQSYKIRSSSEWCCEEKKEEEPMCVDEEEKMEPKPEQVHEKEEDEPKHELVHDNEKTELKNEHMHEEEQKVLKDEHVPEKGEKELEDERSYEKEENMPVLVEEKKELLGVDIPEARELECVELERLKPDVIKFYLNKNQRAAKRSIINLDSSDSESDSEFAPKRKKKPEKSIDTPSYSVLEFRQMLKRKKTRRSCPTKVMWIEQPFKEIDGYEYYKKVQINDSVVSVGDFVSTYNSNSVGCVKYLFENVDEEQLFHVHWFMRSMDTILAEVGHPNELFESNKCQDVLLEDFYQVVSVKFIPTGSDWFDTGNMPYVNLLNENKDPSRFLYYQKRYCEKTARFTDAEPESSYSLIDCYNCERQRKLVQREIPYSEEKSTFDKEENMYALKMVRWRDEEYHVGTCVFLTPGSIMKLKKAKVRDDDDEEEDYDEELYPERYRKPNRVKSVQDEDVLSDPFDVGYICGIWSKRQEITKSTDVKLELKKFYRPHNTSLSQDVIRKLDLNLLYWSDEDCSVDFSKVQGKCYVSYEENLKCSVDEWTKKGPYRFYFSQLYNRKYKIFETPSSFAMKIGNLEKDDEKEHVDIPTEYPSISRPLRSLDVFAGCGGLTEGLHQANLAECHWAIEKDPAAAKAFQLNYPDATVFTDDCNLLLNAVIEHKEKVWRGKKLPQRGDVEMICGGPPCQGFSGMNRFRFGQWSKFNNSLVVSFLSYCDYYRPRFFVMENVRNFVSHEKCIVLKLTLNCLVKMGYQVAFGVLQSGRFGIPQSRRRVIIMAAAPGENLPLHPECTHTFALCGTFETVNVDDTKYVTSARWTTSAPYRMITVYDALSDLPPIKAGDYQVERPYGRKPITHFQRQLRTNDGEGEAVLRDHISKSLSALVVKRLSFIPKKLGCDWRDLPNIVVKLSDGTLTRKLRYTHHDAKQGKSSTGAYRGVCCCANNGGKCRPEFRQGDTLIPWCLPHTSNRHGHWRGLYGRLGWDEYFRTVVTNPEPMGKQGRVVHPEEDRVISVKECARSQGFPDRFKFYGYILDKHRQIGNAVAPPLAKAIGLEIKKCIHEVESKVHVVDE